MTKTEIFQMLLPLSDHNDWSRKIFQWLIQKYFRWYRHSLLLENDNNFLIESRGSLHTLIIRKVAEENFGGYKCSAGNSLGRETADIQLTGQLSTLQVYVKNCYLDQCWHSILTMFTLNVQTLAIQCCKFRHLWHSIFLVFCLCSI